MRLGIATVTWGALLGALGVMSMACGGSASSADKGTETSGPACEEPVRQGNIELCASGYSHRVSTQQCELVPKGAGTGAITSKDLCATDADCEDLAYCVWHANAIGGDRSCEQGCQTDADCGNGRLCLCNAVTSGSCVSADCATDDDCQAGYHCVQEAGSCGRPRFVCQTPEDTCTADTDCKEPSASACVTTGDHRSCGSPPPCAE